MKSKTFFIVPGFTMKASGKPFRWLDLHLKKNGYNVIKFNPVWRRRTNAQVAAEFVKFYKKHKGKNNYVLGFSYGAIVTLLTANELMPKKIYLCSLSPEFKEDDKHLRPWIESIGKRRYKEAMRTSARTLAKSLKIPAVIFWGEKEAEKYPELKIRAEETARLAKKAKLVRVKDAPHKIDFPSYQDAIKRNLK